MSANSTNEAAEDLDKYFGFAEKRIEEWGAEGAIRADQKTALNADYALKREQIARALRENSPIPDRLLLPKPLNQSARNHPLVQALRFESALCRDIKSFGNCGLLELAQSHDRLSDSKVRCTALMSRMEREGIFASPPEEAPAPIGIAPPPIAEPVAPVAPVAPAGPAKPEAAPQNPKAPATPAIPAEPPRKLLDILLDPKSLQYLMLFGGALLSMGLVIWLWAAGVFENSKVVAAAMGLGTACALGGGWALIKKTRHENAGQATTLLACLIMPLNLWFYHSQGLLTLEGHLWMAGVVCCVLYFASAWMLRQSMFVYVSIAGVTMTGLLFLADGAIGKLWEIAAPSTLLVVIGLLAIHAERAFPAEGPFSRKRFGIAFFWSGLTVLSSGLLLLLGAQLAGLFFEPYVHHWGLLFKPEIAEKHHLQMLALALVLAGTYAFIYSDAIIRKAGAFRYMAVFTFIWAEVIGLNLLSIKPSVDCLLAIFFAEATVFYAVAAVIGKKQHHIYLAMLSACGALRQVLTLWQINEENYTLVFAIAGMALLVASRLAALEKLKISGLAKAAFQCGNTLLSLSFIAAMLLTLSRLSNQSDIHSSLLYLLLLLTGLSLSAAWLVRDEHWRRWYLATAVGEGLLTFLVLNVLSDISIWEKMEIFSIGSGLLLLGAGHLGWYRERDQEGLQSSVSLSLMLGSVLASIPLMIAVVIQRSHQTTEWNTLRTMNELGLLGIGLLLVGTGVLFKLKSTTVTGSLMMAVYLLSLVFFIHIPQKLQTVAAYMMIGGGAFFGTAVLLSIYRDRLIALPGNIRRREGVFRVLSWR